MCMTASLIQKCLRTSNVIQGPCFYHFNPSLFLWLTLEPLGQLTGEKHVGQLALAISKATAVILVTLEVMESDLASMVGH